MALTNLDIKNRVFLVTGGTSGVGHAIARGLAREGAKVVIISRSKESGEAALNSITQATGNDRGEILVADLSLQSSIRQAAEEFKRRYENLHVLVNVAGAVYFEKQLTPEGIERSFAVNYLDHFLLTNQLLDILKESKPARVITMAGAPRFLKNPKIDFEDLQVEKIFSGMKATSQALYARIFFAFELAKRLEGSGVTSVAMHPGPVKSKLLGRKGQKVPWYLWAMAPLFLFSMKDECEIGVYLASAKEIEVVTGAFFDDKKQQVPFAFDEAVGKRLWEMSEKLTRTTARL